MPNKTTYSTQWAPPNYADTGQGPFVYFNSGTSYQIASGRMRLAPGGAGAVAAYKQYNTGSKITSMSAQFQFNSAGSTQGGAVGLIAFAGLVGGAVPDAHCHLTIGPTLWAYYVATGGALSLVTFGSMVLPYDTPLSASVSFFGSTAVLAMPDGTAPVVTDARIGSLTGTYACTELFLNAATTDQRPELISDTSGNTFVYTPPTFRMKKMIEGSLRYSSTTSTTTYKLGGIWKNLTNPGMGQLDAATWVFNKPTVVDFATASELLAFGVGTVTTA